MAHHGAQNCSVTPRYNLLSLGLRCSQASATDEALDAVLHLDGERQGVHRIAAALKAHAWPGLTLKRMPGSAPAAAPAADAPALPATPNGAAEPHRSAAEAEDRSESARPAAEAAPSSLEAPASRGGSTGAASSAAAAANGHAHAAGERRGCAAGPVHSEGLGLEDGLEEEVLEDEFERLMGRMASERARIRDLPDAQRREAAARMAERLLAAVGLDEGDTSEEDDA